MSRRAGPGLATLHSARGPAAGDIDGDGDVDLVVSNMDEPATVLRNETPRRGAWLLVEAAGAVRVELRAGELELVRYSVHGGSYCSVSDRRFHFGPGSAARIDELAAVWPDGQRTILRDLEVDRIVRVSR